MDRDQKSAALLAVEFTQTYRNIAISFDTCSVQMVRDGKYSANPSRPLKPVWKTEKKLRDTKNKILYKWGSWRA